MSLEEGSFLLLKDMAFVCVFIPFSTPIQSVVEALNLPLKDSKCLYILDYMLFSDSYGSFKWILCCLDVFVFTRLIDSLFSLFEPFGAFSPK